MVLRGRSVVTMRTPGPGPGALFCLENMNNTVLPYTVSVKSATELTCVYEMACANRNCNMGARALAFR
jgi:hypothetical protein